jgi:hypothetical protein
MRCRNGLFTVAWQPENRDESHGWMFTNKTKGLLDMTSFCSSFYCIGLLFELTSLELFSSIELYSISWILLLRFNKSN